MPKGSNQKLKLYYLAKIMVAKTDEEHYLTMPEIMKELEKYEITAERRSIYRDLQDLEKFGIEIEGEPVGKSYHYHVVSHQFELPELKLLVDAIQSSRFITAKKSGELIGKLEGFVSEYEAKKLQRQVYVSDRVKTMNESIYYNVDAIHNAIAQNCKIQFQYFQWNTKKEMELRHGGAYYHISPWGLLWDNQNYYLVAYDSAGAKIKHYRVDKMLHISMMEEEREGKEAFAKLNMASYTNMNFGMFGGEKENVKLKVANRMAGVIIDRFGKNVMMVPHDADSFTIHIDVQVSDQFFSWVAALGDEVKILGPETVVDQMKGYIRRLARQYEVEIK